ncbi:MAG: glycosyltransferase [Chloroflexota bacterium]
MLPQLGLWTQRLIQCVTPFAELKVLAPIPSAPPRVLARFAPYYERYRAAAPSRWDGPVEVLHPRFLTGPGQSLYAVETASYLAAALPYVMRLRARFRFDLIHAHFTYPDGVAAVALGRLFRVPVVITEHVLWLPWMNDQPVVRRQAAWAARECAAHLAVSHSVRQHIGQVTGRPDRVHVVPNVVDGSVFTPAAGRHPAPRQILFVGAVRVSKGVDVLLETLALLRRRGADVRLTLVGEPYYRAYQREAERLRDLAEALGVTEFIDMLGGRPPAEVARLMAESAVVVLPSRRESFGAVLIEALACGTPVVATRCGGPEEIVMPEVGKLVAPEDPAGLADALFDVLEDAHAYDPQALREYALTRFGPATIGQQIATRYDVAYRDGTSLSATTATKRGRKTKRSGYHEHAR